MIRFHFDAHACVWRVQMLKWGIFWMTIKTEDFVNLTEAHGFVHDRGLSDHYAIQDPPRERIPITLNYGTGAR